jgi:methyl-accepting chemotaxis protein
MFATIKTVESVVKEAIVILKSATASKELALNGNDVSDLAYRKAVFPNYRKALSHIRRNVDQVNRADAYDELMAWAETTILDFRAQMSVVPKIAPEVAEAILAAKSMIDRVAELEAQLVAVKAADDAKALVIKDLNVKLDKINNKLNKAEKVGARLQKRTVVIGKTLTTVFVENKVEIKPTFR